MTVPVVVFVSAAPAPPRTAETVPSFAAYPEAVSVPLAIVPDVSVTVPTVSAKPPRSRVPPVSTVIAPASANLSAEPRSSVPALIVVPPA